MNTSDQLPRKFDHLMIDIETLALHTRKSVILSVGMVEFDPWCAFGADVIGAKIMLVPDVMTQIMLGRVISDSTVKFWNEQPKEAAAHWREGQPGCTLAHAVEVIRTACSGKTGVWANGILFDLGNIEGLVEQVTPEKPSAPWHYQAARDMRTYCRETPATFPDGDETGIAEAFPNLIDHEPISDCIKQIDTVWRHWPR